MDEKKIDLHEVYANVDCDDLHRASIEAAKAGNDDEAEFWGRALDGLMQIRQKKLIESGKYYG